MRYIDGLVRDVLGQDGGDEECKEGEGDDDAKDGEGDDQDQDEEGKEKEGFESLAPEKDGEEEGEELMEDEQQPQVRQLCRTIVLEVEVVLNLVGTCRAASSNTNCRFILLASCLLTPNSAIGNELLVFMS